MNSPDLPNRKSYISLHWPLWALLLLCAGTPRIIAAFVLPNEEGDPYAYVQAIDMMRTSIVGGTFTLSELFGFWLPMYQFICALITVVVDHPLYVAKVVSALCGTGVCLLVFELAEQLTANRLLSLVAFGLIALNPIHIMYSAFSMSDVPHGLAVLGSLYFAIKNRWVIAAGLVAIGGLMRPESWLFIVLLPALQFVLHRRISVTSFFVALSAPLIWLYISWSATGNAFEYFNVRGDYIRDLMLSDPGLASLSTASVIANLQTLLYSAGHAVIVACFIAVWLVSRRFKPNKRGPDESSAALLITLAYFFSCLGFLLLAFLTKNQPAIFARYCLGVFALGIPVLAWLLKESRRWTPVRARSVVGLLAVLCLWQWTVQLRDAAGYVNQVAQKRIVANYLRDNLRGASDLKIFCDDDTIKVLAGIPADSCLSSPGSPRGAKPFLDYLRENRVGFVVYERRNGSAAERVFRDLGDEDVANHFQVVASTSSDLRLYRTSF
jgi:hypothetical protein